MKTSSEDLVSRELASYAVSKTPSIFSLSCITSYLILGT